MRSVMTHQFSQVPRADIPRSSFDRTHGYKTTFNSGYLVPFYVDLAVPGDTFNATTNIFCRLATPLHPFMDNMFVDVMYFAVPIRLLQTNFVKMMGEQDNPGDTTSYLTPKITAPVGGWAEDSLQDYFAWPTKVAGLVCNNYLGRAYNQIYNAWFRDQNLQNSVVKDVDDGPDSPSDYVLLRRGKRHDYFTSCLPWPQKGAPVQLPLGSTAPVLGIYTPSSTNTQAVAGVVAVNGAPAGVQSVAGSGSTVIASKSAVGTTSATAFNATNAAVYADLSAATAATINQLRQAFAVQRLLERDARGGTRYTEIIQAHFGVTSPDARLQRPEYLGGGSVPMNVNPIAQTSAIDTQPTPQGNLAAMGTASMHGVGFTKSFTEHTILMGLVSVRADLNYQQGLDRMWSISTKYDFYWPGLSHIGEQAVLSKEIYADGTADDELVWGYQEAWADWRYKPSKITGRFRSNATQSLDTWHLAQDFSVRPTLNSTFIVENPPVERVVAVETEPQILFDSFLKLRCARPMPVYSVPGLIDHF